MQNWLLAPPAERRLLGSRPLQGPTPWVIAIMSFSIMIVAAAGLALANTAGVVARGVEARFSVQVPDGGRRLAPTVQALKSTPGVTSVRAVPDSEMRATLQRWLGPAGAAADLPVPALVMFDIRPGADIGAIQKRVAATSPTAQVVAHRESVAPLLGSMRVLQWIALVLVLLLSGAAAAAVVLAARGALDTHRSTIEVMHGIGATDIQVTHLFQRKIALDAFAGSVGGALLASVVLLLLSAGATLVGQLTGGAAFGIVDFVVLAMIPIALTVLATVVARTAVLRALRQDI